MSAQGIEEGADPGLIGRGHSGVQGLGSDAEQTGHAGAAGAGQTLGGGGEIGVPDRQIQKTAHRSVVTTILPMA